MANNGYKILLPTDGSHPAIAATIRAVDLAKDRKARLLILKVNEIEGAGMEKLAEDSALMRTAGIDGVAYARDLATKNGVPFDIIYKEGAVVGEIISVATERGTDIIVMGSATIKGLPGLYLGSVSKGVLKEAPCDVVVVKLTEEEMKKAVQLAHDIAASIKKVPVVFDMSEYIRSKKFRVGAVLMAIYGIMYAVFTVLGTFVKSGDKPIFSTQMLGANLGIVFGMIVIVLAIIMAVGFNWYAGRSEKAEKKTGGS